MTSLQRILTRIGVFALLATATTGAVFADSGNVRIVRLSLVQGDVRFAREVKGDPLTDSRGDWEAAALNLPVRQGYVLATDNGRAEVEFENGAVAFLAENTVLEFFDLSSEDGAFTTRLILRQGSAEFYVNPGRGDYFSVTGGDFSVQAETKTTFRMNNFDDGSSVNVLHGRLTALANKKNTLLEKDQSLSLRAGEPDSMVVEHSPASDDFDQWVAGRIDTARTATSAAMQYANSYEYTSGFGDLYTYGAWFPVAGYGNCWRPYGVGLGWSPFDFGNWFFDPVFGWSFLGSQPWGWLPYHYGGWMFRPGVGWVWSPSGSFGSGGVGRWRPVTGVWMRSGTGNTAIVPSHPLDVKGKPPLNQSEGMFAVTSRGVSGRMPVENSERWKVENKPARDVMQNQLAQASAPARVTRTMASAGVTGSQRVSGGNRDSAIVYDRTERRFVNSNAPQSTMQRTAENNQDKNTTSTVAPAQGTRARIYPEQSRSGSATSQVPVTSDRTNGREGSAIVPSARPTVAPPSVPRSVVTERVFNGSGSGSSGSGSARGSSSSGSNPAPRASAPSSSSSGSSARSSGSSGSGGGRPH
jgi:hypothetical protein